MEEGVIVVPDLVKECAEIVQPDHATAPIAMRIAVDLPMLRGDHRCIRRALIHLLRNAVEFTPSGTTIRMDACLTSQGSIAISVSDSAIGTKCNGADRQAQRLDAKALSLVNAFIKLHDGEIAFETLSDQGTTIAIVFPPQRTVLQQPAV